MGYRKIEKDEKKIAELHKKYMTRQLNKSQMAAELGIARSTLYRWLKEFQEQKKVI